jgi:transcriptional antiterminator RfaH
MKSWYAVHTHPRAEIRVVNHLKRQGFDTYLPLFLKRRSHSRRIDWLPTPFFPRYLFVGMNIEKVSWGAVRSTVGVSNVICSGENPAQVPPDVLELLKSREDENGFVKLGSSSSIHPGDRVQIIDGALGDLVAIVKESHGLDRITLLLTLMGRQVSVKTSSERISAVS